MLKCECCGYEFLYPVNRYNQIVSVWDEDAECPNCGAGEPFEELSSDEDEE